MKLRILCLFLALVLTSRAEDWTVKDKTYHNVTVTKVDPDRVQIVYDGGVGSVPLADLPADLQKKFNYDPAKAAEVERERLAAQQAGEAARIAEAARTNARDQADANQTAANTQERWRDHVKASEIEDLCAMVKLDEQAKAGQVHTAVSNGPTWGATGNAAVASTDQTHPYYIPNQAIAKRVVQEGLPELWAPSIPVATRLLERPCTPQQTEWLNRFIACAESAGGVNPHYGDMVAALVLRPPPPAAPTLSAAPSAYAVNPNPAPPTYTPGQSAPSAPTPTSEAPTGTVADPSEAALEQAAVSYTWAWADRPYRNGWDELRFNPDKTVTAWSHGKIVYTGHWKATEPTQIKIFPRRPGYLLLNFDPSLSRFTVMKSNGRPINMRGNRKDAVGGATDNPN